MASPVTARVQKRRDVLRAAGLRPIGGYSLPEWLRVTIGTEPENARFLEALEKAL